MNTRSNKTKNRRKNRYKRRRYLKKKRESFPLEHSAILNSFPQQFSNILNRFTINMNENYWNQSREKMMEWHHKHEIAYWKSKAEALSYENKILHNIVQNMYCNGSGHPSFKMKTVPKLEETKDESDSEKDLEISEEFLAYLKTNMEHKMEIEKFKAEEEEIEDGPIQPVDVERTSEMNVLYGNSSDLIIGLETKVNLNYDTYKDGNKPVYWPYFPLNPWT